MGGWLGKGGASRWGGGEMRHRNRHLSSNTKWNEKKNRIDKANAVIKRCGVSEQASEQESMRETATEWYSLNKRRRCVYRSTTRLKFFCCCFVDSVFSFHSSDILEYEYCLCALDRIAYSLLDFFKFPSKSTCTNRTQTNPNTFSNSFRRAVLIWETCNFQMCQVINFYLSSSLFKNRW